MTAFIGRREFITLFGGAAAWPLAARAQQGERVRRIGVLMSTSADDAPAQARLAAFMQGLQELGWGVGRNVRVDIRWPAADPERTRKTATELLALAPDVIFATGSATVTPLQQMSRTVPIVFVIVPDPVGAGFVDSLARPGGNITGFTSFEFGLAGKWLELLKQIVPGLVRAAVIRDPGLSAGIGQWAAIQSAAPSLGVEVYPINVREPNEIERALAALARSTNVGLIATGSALTVMHRDLIVGAAARYNLPAIYYESSYPHSGGLISYGPDFLDQYRRAAVYVDRVLKGEKPADLPVQLPTKYELAINLKTVKTLGLTVPPTLLARADEVIE